MEENKDDGFIDLIRKKILQLIEWVKPVPSDPFALKAVKLLYKSILLLLLLLFSPVLLVIMTFVFFAAL